MKKIKKFVLSIAVTAGRRNGILVQRAVDEKIRKGLNNWVLQGAYLQEDSDLDSVAEIIGVDKSQLQYYFRSIMKKRFSTWKKELRIDVAKKLLSSKHDMSIAAVGAAVGISDKSNFRKRFIEVTGFSPTEWKNKCEK